MAPVGQKARQKGKYRCGFCRRSLPTIPGLKRHVQGVPACLEKWKALLATQRTADEEESTMEVETLTAAFSEDPFLSDNIPDPRRATVEEVPDEGDEPSDFEVARFYEYFAADSEAGKSYGRGETKFERWRREEAEVGRSPWAPFASRAEWELASWLARNVGQNQIEEFLKLEIVRRHLVSTHVRFDRTLIDRFRHVTWTQGASISSTNNSINFPHRTNGYATKSMSSEIFLVKIFNL